MSSLKLSEYFNALKGITSWYASRLTNKPVVWGMPFAAGIELTNNCNLACPECPTGAGELTRQKGFMDLELFEKIISEKGNAFLLASLYFQGEPMLHPQFFKIISLAGRLKTVVSTNGHFLEGENAAKLAASGLSKVIISLDGMDNPTYNIYRRNGNIDRVLTGISELCGEVKASHSKLKVELQFLVSRHNEGQIPDARVFAKKAGASLRLKSMQIIHDDMIEYWLPTNERFRRYISGKGNYKIKNTLPSRCCRLWFNPVITWNGLVVPCCFDKNGDYVMGDLSQSTFREIWYGEKYMEFRKTFMSGREKIKMCANCTSGLKGVRF